MTKTIALIAHDNKKKDLLEWVEYNKKVLQKHTIVTTGTTGKLIKEHCGIDNIRLVKSGPLGGDAEIGALIANNEVDLMIFFWDGLDIHAHIDDVRSLLRLAVVWNIPTACNRSTADMIIGSNLFYDETYQRTIPDYSTYINRKVL
jgi:methylglyoxal synthase